MDALFLRFFFALLHSMEEESTDDTLIGHEIHAYRKEIKQRSYSLYTFLMGRLAEMCIK